MLKIHLCQLHYNLRITKQRFNLFIYAYVFIYMYINTHMDGKHIEWKILFTSMTSIIWKTHLYICTFYTLRLQKKRKNILNICHTWQISSDRENWFFKYFCKQRNEDFTSHYVFVIIPIKKCSGIIIILWFVWICIYDSYE